MKARPFLKWAGGKSKLLPALVDAINHSDVADYRYCEPFLGGGALFFEIQPLEALLRDANARLINTYEVVRDSLGALIERLRELEAEHCRAQYELARDALNSGELDDVDEAAVFVYLNKTCFNGVYRVNGSGAFNVPMGSYKNPRILDEPALRAASSALQHTAIEVGDFSDLPDRLPGRCFVYLDPPYWPGQNGFTTYVPGGFGEADQLRLREVFEELDRRGHKLLLSNSPAAAHLYNEAYHVDVVRAPRSVNSKGGERGLVDEILVRNY